MSKPPFLYLPPACDRRRLHAAFTLVELLVSMVVVVLIVVMYAQIIGGASTSIRRSSKGMDSDQAALVTLDRIGTSIKGMVSSGSATLVVIKNASATNNASDGLAMVTNGRVRSRVAKTASSIDVSDSSNIRFGARGFCIMGTANPDASTNPLTPVLNWGDGTTTFVPPSGTTAYVAGTPLQALSGAVSDVTNQINGNVITSPTLEFTPVSPSIFRFEVCFLLSDGSIASGYGPNGKPLPLTSFSGQQGTTLLPRNKNFVAGEAFANPPAQFAVPAYPLAFNAQDSDAAPNADSGGVNIYVRAVIVGVVSLDVATQKLLTSDQINTLARADVLAKADAQTPLDAWNITGTTAAAIATRNKLSPALFSFACGAEHSLFPALLLCQLIVIVSP